MDEKEKKQHPYFLSQQAQEFFKERDSNPVLKEARERMHNALTDFLLNEFKILMKKAGVINPRVADIVTFVSDELNAVARGLINAQTIGAYSDILAEKLGLVEPYKEKVK
jgi:hypothetical protein